MAFVALLPVRDEADIIGECLRHLLTWADRVFVFDTGSIDHTWDIVQDAALKDARIRPVRQQPVYFSETRLRAYLFDVARVGMRDGDWFLRVDADEFHQIPPPVFVREHMSPTETIAYHQYYNFCLLANEVAAWERGEETIADRHRPIANRRQHYVTSIYSEPRLCRYRSTMRWPQTVSFPFNAGFVARERLPIRHYPHRDPVQLERRCRLRAVMLADNDNRQHWSSPELHHWAEREWRKFITQDNEPGLATWRPGEVLPPTGFRHHLKPPPIRAVQWAIHRFLLPTLDRRRDGFPGESALQLISPETQQRLHQELRLP